MTDAKPTENEQTKVEEKPKTKIVLMKKGDYQVHILLEEINNLGTTIIMATHLLENIENAADYIGVMEDGSLNISVCGGK